MFLIDLDQHRIIEDDEIKSTLANEEPYDEWLYSGLVRFEDLPDLEHIVHTHASVTRRQQVFGYTEEELRILLAPLARAGAEAIGSMGTDTPIAAISDRPRQLFDYFSQQFAQVTNPPLDAIREEVVTSLAGTIGPERNILAPMAASCRMLQLPFPVLDNDELAKIRHMNKDGDMPGFSVHVIRGLYEVHGGGAALRVKLDEICAEVSAAIADGARIIVLSDRHSNADLAPIPSLLLTGAVHHHMVREKLRTQAGLIVETGDVREVHHVALLIGYGATAVNPYLALESAEDLARERIFVEGVAPAKAVRNVVVRPRQGRPQGHEQGRRLDRGVLHRRPDLRGCRPVPRGRRRVLHRHVVQARRCRASTCSRPRCGRATSRRIRPAASPARVAISTSAASTSGVARVRSTCSTPRRSSASSTRRARAATRSSSSTPRASTTSPSG